MLSSSDEASDMARAEQLGANGYLIKHPSPETIAAIVRGATAQNTELMGDAEIARDNTPAL